MSGGSGDLAVNAVIRDVDTGALHRLLHRHPASPTWAWIRLPAKRAFPQWREERDLRDGLASGRLVLAEEDPYPPPQAHGLSAAERGRRDERWEAVRDLVQDPAGRLFFREHRSAVVDQCARACNRHPATIGRWLRLWWERGQVPNALVPLHRNSGGPGQPKAANNAKHGRPYEDVRTARREGRPVPPQGVNATPAVVALLVKGFWEFRIRKGMTWKKAYYQTVLKYFDGQEEDFLGNRIRPPLPPRQRPTQRQFEYHGRKAQRANEAEALRKRHGRVAYNLRHRPVLHTSTDREDGPGLLALLDATQDDIELISAIMPEQAIGRPALYLVEDSFSGLITGVHAHPGPPTWNGMRMALENAFTDKVAFCRRFDIHITPDQWPANHVSAIVRADRGEARNKQAEHAAYALQFTLQNTGSYRADWKGLLERRFPILQDALRGRPGYVPSRESLRGRPDPKLAARLTLWHYYRVTILTILEHNNAMPAPAGRIPRGFPSHEEAPTALDLFHWGAVHRSGTLRTLPPDVIRQALLPWKRVRLTRDGLEFQGLYYAPDALLNGEGEYSQTELENWFLRDVVRRKTYAPGQYNPADAGELYIVPARGEAPLSCSLIRADVEFDGLSWSEIDQVREERRKASRRRKETLEQISLKFESLRNATFADAAALVAGPPSRKNVKAAAREEKRYMDRERVRTGAGVRKPALPPPNPEVEATVAYLPEPDDLALLEELQEENP